MAKKIYEVYDLCGKKLFEGTADKCAEMIHCEDSTIRNGAYKRNIMNMYVIKGTDRKVESRKKKKPAETEPSYSSDPYECLKLHLKIYRNAYVTFDPVPYFPWLLDEGYDCRCREIQVVDDRPKGKKKKYHYVVELANAR